MKDVREYAPDEVVMTFGGMSVEGWDRISIRRTQPSFKMIEGIRGKNTRARVRNTAAEIEVVLSQTSPTNYIFSQIVELDEKYGTGRIDLEIKDVLTGEMFSTSEGFLEKPSDVIFEDDVSDRVWRILCLSSKVSRGTGGNIGSLVDRVTSLF